MPPIETTQGTDAAGLRFVAYAAPGRWCTIAQECDGGWWSLWLVPPDKGETRRPLFPRGRWSEGFACGVAEFVAEALRVAVEPAEAEP